jgi:ABC-type transporter Mla MlaB component
VVHDPELDEAVIAFANADFGHCEHALTQLVSPGGARYEHVETWHVLFDLYRAIGQQAKFESLAIDFANLFGSSSPQWFSLPRMVADAAAADDSPSAPRVAGEVGWVSPPDLDVESVARLRSTSLQLPLPWVLDWSAIRRVDVEAAAQLQRLFRQWAPQAIDMRWMAAERLLAALQEAAPTGVRDADPAFWMARLEALRLANRPDQFDETAIDYCVTYEVSPPSWERARCQVRSSNANNSTTTPPLSIVGEVSSSFMESGLQDDSHTGVAITTVDLSGQLAGDIGPTLQQIDRKLGAANLVQVSCARLIRVDFIAAGDLLNWVLAKRTENRSVTFVDAHRLVALFFGAMGINEHARVQIPRD